MEYYGKTKKYNVSLADDEVKELKSIIRKKGTTRTVRCRCQIPVDLDDAHGKSLTYEQTAKSNGVCISTVQNAAKLFATGGISEVTTIKHSVNSDNARRAILYLISTVQYTRLELSSTTSPAESEYQTV